MHQINFKPGTYKLIGQNSFLLDDNLFVITKRKNQLSLKLKPSDPKFTNLSLISDLIPVDHNRLVGSLANKKTKAQLTALNKRFVIKLTADEVELQPLPSDISSLLKGNN